ncbi:MAG: hypothetical protein AB1758_20235 [Candidatus Eremiobacterota bacterium]
MSAPHPRHSDNPWNPDAWVSEVNQWRRRDFPAVLKAMLEGDLRGEGPGAGGGFLPPAPQG